MNSIFFFTFLRVIFFVWATALGPIVPVIPIKTKPTHTTKPLKAEHNLLHTLVLSFSSSSFLFFLEAEIEHALERQRERAMATEAVVEGATPPVPEAGSKHKLERKWTFWFDNQSKPKQGAAWGTSLRKVYAFDTVEEFWWCVSPPPPLIFLQFFFFFPLSFISSIELKFARSCVLNFL